MKHPPKFKAFLASVRTPNLPSVACNVFSGIAFAAVTAPITTWHAAAAITSGVCLYLAGNLLNDWHDREWDATHRPERALPQHIFQASSYLMLAIALCGAALVAAAINTRSLVIAIVIIGLILIYTKTHKVWKLAVIPMGLCRSLLPLLGFSACAAPLSTSNQPPHALVLFSISLLVHVGGLSLIARLESFAKPSPKLTLNVFYPIAVAFTTLAAHSGKNIGLNHVWPAALPYLAWSFVAIFILRKSVHSGVSMLLAGIPLIDWMFLIPLSKYAGTQLSPLVLLVPPAACILGKFLQKIVPAT